MRTLKSTLRKWTDVDVAAWELAVSLGMMPNDIDLFTGDAKHVFWSDNPIGNALTDFLFKLVDAGVLERTPDDDPNDQVRWNPLFKDSWEG